MSKNNNKYTREESNLAGENVGSVITITRGLNPGYKYKITNVEGRTVSYKPLRIKNFFIRLMFWIFGSTN